MTKQVVDTERIGPVLLVRLNSHETRNALTPDMREQIGAAVRQAEDDRTVRSVYLTGEGSSFCSGGDLATLRDGCEPWAVHRRFREFSRWLCPLIALDKPVAVGVNGHAVGAGMGLALTADVLIAAESASFLTGFFRIGAVPDLALMYHLPRLIGMARARRMLFSNRSVSAAEALQLGLVGQVVPDSDLYQAGLDEALRLAQGPAQVMGLAKTLLARSFETSLADMLAFEGLGQALAMSSPEFREGLAAVVNRRHPNFMEAAS